MKAYMPKKTPYSRVTNSKLRVILWNALVSLEEERLGKAAENLDDYEYEEHEDFDGTWFLNVWAENKTCADQIEKALRNSAKRFGVKVEVSGMFGEADKKTKGDRAGRWPVDFFLFADDFPGCEYEWVEA